MSWIKICGLTSAAAVDAALAAGVDAIGFVCAPSVRQLEPQAAARLAASARGRVRLVAVTRHPQQPLVDEILATLAPDVLQSDCEDFDALRLPAHLERLPVLRAGRALPARLPPRVLFEGRSSGTGKPWAWSEVGSVARRTELILAGGLSTETVATAIASVRPFGVDVSSGVEEAPGIKSPPRIAAFVEAARAAFRALAAASPAVQEKTR